MNDVAQDAPGRSRSIGVIVALGTAQTIAWASSYYLPAILADSDRADLGVSRTSFSRHFLGCAVALGPASVRRVGRAIDQRGGRGVLAISNLVLAAGLVLLGRVA